MAVERITTFNLGSQHVSGAVFSKRPSGGLALERFERANLIGEPSNGQHLAQTGMALKEVASALKAKGGEARVVVSGQPVFIRFVKLPPLDIDQVDQIVEFEAQQQVPFPINEVVWDYQLMGIPDDPEVEVLLAAIKSDELDELDEVVRSAGLKTPGTEVAPISLYNAFRFNYSDLEGTTLLIDIGARTTNLLFIEGDKVFIRTIKIGGTDITRAIAKEFNVSFEDAEQRKIADGFVALGGPYADHEDPVIAGVSKVIRNSLTRLHSEIMRTTNFYRSQQGGSAPDLALLSGATVALPFMREFFAEKLNIPIDYFNALRNISAGSDLDREGISTQAHTLGEVVGSALAASGKAPLQLELAPESIRMARAFQKKKPFLVAATVTLAALLGALGFWFSKAGVLAEGKADSLTDRAETLQTHSDAIDLLKDRLSTLETRKEPYVKATFDRAYWTAVFNDFSNRMDTDMMWITLLEPFDVNNLPVLEKAVDSAASANVLGATPSAAAGQPADETMVHAIHIKGLYREDSSVVNRYYDALRESPFLDIKDLPRDDVLKRLEVATQGQYAWQWEMILPLPENARISFKK